jgi:hypothetical protein
MLLFSGLCAFLSPCYKKNPGCVLTNTTVLIVRVSIQTTKMNTELENNINGVNGKHQTPEAQRMPGTQQ